MMRILSMRLPVKFALWFACGVLLAATSFGQKAELLPRIRVAADGRGFETVRGQPFVPFGVSYYRPGQGWAPQLWKKFDAEATRKDFARMKELGVNCVRVFLTYGSFLMESNQITPEGLAKFDQFLQIAEDAGIYVHPTGPDRWEGSPDWANKDWFADEAMLSVVESYWKEFATRYRGRAAIFSYDLLNEPEVQWDTAPMREKWNRWLAAKYRSTAEFAAAWGVTNQLTPGSIPIPPLEDCAGCPRLLDFQHFRESIAEEWTRRQVVAIKAADPGALVSIGLIQWSVPSVLPTSWHYSGFRPEREAKLLDYLEIHFYPLANGHYDYQGTDDEAANLAYLASVVREVARFNKPAIIGEFGWYGGGKLTYGKHPSITEEQQAEWCRKLVESTAGFACGWLNWGFYDQPEAGDVSQLTGLCKSTGETKAWGREFKELSERYRNKKFSPPQSGTCPALDWDRCITSAADRAAFKQDYLKAWKASQ